MPTLGLPTATGLAYQQTIIRQKYSAHYTRSQVSHKGYHYPLPHIAGLLGSDSQQIGLGLITHQHLSGKGAKLAPCGIPHRVSRRVGNAVMRKEQHRCFALILDPLPLNVGRRWGHARQIHQPRRMAIKSPFSDQKQFRGADVFALIFGIPKLTFWTARQARRAAQTAGIKLITTLGIHAYHPATEPALRAHILTVGFVYRLIGMG